MSESFDAAAPSEARKQGTEQGAQLERDGAAAGARSAAPTSQGAPNTGAAPAAAPEPSGALATTPAAAPAPSEALATTPTGAPALPPPSEQPVPLSNGVAESADSSRSTAQLGLATLTAVLAALSLGLWLRRGRGI